MTPEELDADRGRTGASRDLQLSMLPELVPHRVQGWMMPSVFRGTNSELIAAVAPMYLTGERIMDATYGNGGWWHKFRPLELVAHDLDPAKGDGVDFTRLPEADRTYDAIAFDPPYVPAGGQNTTTVPRFRKAYGIDKPRSAGSVFTMMCAGMAECERVLKPRGWLLVKCSDFVNSATFTMGSQVALDMADELKLRTWDLIVHHTGSGPQSREIETPKRARRHHSYLMVFRKRARGARS
jgi:hypothetical protein